MIDGHLNKFEMLNQCQTGRKCSGTCQSLSIHSSLRILLMAADGRCIYQMCKNQSRFSLEKRILHGSMGGLIKYLFQNFRVLAASNIVSLIPLRDRENARWGKTYQGNIVMFDNILRNYIFITLWPRNSTSMTLMQRCTGENENNSNKTREHKFSKSSTAH